MNRRLSLAVLSLLLAGCSSPPDAPPTVEEILAASRDRNVLVVLLDAAAADHFGCYGYPRDTTPHLDRVAAEAFVFDRAYAQASGTMLSVISFFTSRYPIFGMGRYFKPSDTVMTIPADLPTMAEYLAPRFGQRLGYTSNVWMKSRFGHARGFTEYWEQWEAEGDSTDADFVVRATEWMQTRAADGFFAYLHLMKPHSPYDPPEPWFSRFADAPPDPAKGRNDYLQSLSGQRPDARARRDIVALYDANLAHVDALLGDMIAGLDSAGVWENTVFVLMADHGQALFEHGHPHGHGGVITESVLRVPLLIRIPGVPGRRLATPVELVDLVPTLADLAGAAVPADSLAGRSLVPLLGGIAASDGHARLIHSRTNRRMPPVYTLTRGRFKLTFTPAHKGAPSYALYDLTADPGEASNLLDAAPDHPQGRELKALMKTWLERGGTHGAGGDAVDFDVFDAEEVERLRSLGYAG